MTARGKIVRLVPAVAVVRTYRRCWLRHDLVAGLVLTALLVPQGMAYAELAGLPPVTGLYATLVPLLVYAVFGPSRILVLGPDSAVAPLVAAAIVPLAAPGDMTERIELAGMLALLVGGLCILGGIAKFGFMTDLLSKPVRVGYLAGIALTVIASQLPKLFGFSVDGDSFVADIRGFVGGIDQTNWQALTIGLACLAVILVCGAFAPKVPGVFVAVVGATVVVGALGLAGSVAVVGEIPSGLPSFAVPSVSASDLGHLAGAAVAIAFVAFADTSVLSRSYAGRLRQDVDQNRELAALGAANAAAGFFQGFPISSSSSRTPVAESAGSKTQLTGVVGAVSLAVLLAFATGLVKNIPSAALAAVVMAAVIRLIDVDTLRRLWRVRRSEAAVALAGFLGVTLLGVLPGIGVAVGLSLLIFLRRAWRPHDTVLGRVPGMKGYHDVGRHPEAMQVPGLVLYRFDAPLFFANADYFQDQVIRLVRESETPVSWVIVAAEPITDVDITAAEMLEDLDRELAEDGVELAFAELKGHVRDRLVLYGLVERVGRHRFYPTIGVAVRAFVDHSGVSWVDWEDAEGGAVNVARPEPGS